MDHYDVIIIGTGAGGGTLAHRLAPSGKRILLLERGGYLPREPENWDSHEVFNQRPLPLRRALDRQGRRGVQPHQQYFVGGNTKFYGAILFRLRERDFGEVRHYGGVSPAWPISYADLEPYYAEAEQLYLVHGERGEDPTEPSASGPFPLPGGLARAAHPAARTTTSQRTGHHPFHLPVGVDLNESDPEAGRCVRCDRFDGFPCLTDGKADAHVRCVRPALRACRTSTLRTHAKVERLETDAGGRSVTAVVVDRRGDARSATAPTSSSSPPAPSTRPRCCCARRPTATRAGWRTAPTRSGRNYMAHINSGVIAISQTPNETKFQKTLGVNDYYWGAEDSRAAARAHPDARQERPQHPARRRAVVRARPRARLHGQARDRLLADQRGPAAPRQPRHGRPPGPRSTSPRPTTTRRPTGGCCASSRACWATSAASQAIPSWTILDQRIPLAGVAHQCGTVRFGEDPASSVLDVNCRAHELDNLYVVDTSFFPSSSAVNPALTAMANALRVGDHLLERLGAPAAARPTASTQLQETAA